MRIVLLSTAVGLLLSGAAMAGDCCTAPACCDQTHECCHSCGVRKVCKVVCEMKKVKKTTWVVECEEFCASLPNCKRPCKSCCNTGNCGEECCCDPCASLRRPMVPPKCGKVRCRKKLVKKEIICEVPVYKCVVVCVNSCCEAAACCGEEADSPAPAPKAAPAPEAAPVPEAPAPAAAAGDIAPVPPLLGTTYLQSLRASLVMRP